MSQIQTKFLEDAVITEAKIATDAVTSGKIAANAVDSSEINASAVTTAKIAADAVTGAKIRLDNNEYLKARNAANSANIDVLKVNASDVVEFASFPQKSGSPSNANDLVNKSYVDSVSGAASSLMKEAARVVSKGNIALTGGAALSIDGVSLANGNRVLLVGQTTASQNGLYEVSGIGTAYVLTRTSDANASSEVSAGMSVWVLEGSNYSNQMWTLDTIGPITLDTTSLSFERSSFKDYIETRTLDSTDITNQYWDVAYLIKPNSLILTIDGAFMQKDVDYSLSTVSGATRLTFLGDLATGGASALVAGDKLYMQYSY